MSAFAITKKFIRWQTKLLIFAIAFSMAIPFYSLQKVAACTGTRCHPFGTLELSGASWLDGAGADVFSNGATADVPSPYSWNQQLTPTGQTVTTGIKWQCVELVNRVYAKNGWISSRWIGDGRALFDNAPTGFHKEANNDINYINKGDVVVLQGGDGGYGHASIVNKVTNNADGTKTVETVNQNTSQVYLSSKLTGKTLASPISGYTVKGIVHAPTSVPLANNGQGSGVGTAAFKGSNKLSINQGLYQNQYILSNNGQFVLMMEANGNLVLYGPGYIRRWESKTTNLGGGYVVLQPDGNFVMYKPDGKTPVWSNNKPSSGASYIAIQDDGNLVAYTFSNVPVWASNTGGFHSPAYKGGDKLVINQGLYQNQYIRSADKRYFVMMQTDGSLVVYGPGYHVLWGSNTGGTGAGYAVLQQDGNMVLYMPDGRTSVWGSNTVGGGGTYVAVQNDGNFVIYNANNLPIWATGTAGKI